MSEGRKEDEERDNERYKSMCFDGRSRVEAWVEAWAKQWPHGWPEGCSVYVGVSVKVS